MPFYQSESRGEQEPATVVAAGLQRCIRTKKQECDVSHRLVRISSCSEVSRRNMRVVIIIMRHEDVPVVRGSNFDDLKKSLLH
jgi:hypothetical protein